MISGGVPDGANTPCHSYASKPGSVSATVGTSGSVANLPRPVCARHLIVPDCTWPIEAAALEK